MSISRRKFLYYTGPLLALPTLPPAWGSRSDDYKNSTTPFSHGVASGDPQPDRVVLWTRVTSDVLAPAQVVVTWTIADDVGFQHVVATGVTRTDEQTDFTVKVDPEGLKPHTTYYYRFHALGYDSPIGRTKTLPLKHAERLRIAAVSNADRRYGYFNAYAALALRPDLDAVLHLGDYLDEGADGPASASALSHTRLPEKHPETLADFRKRHAEHKADADLQAAQRQNPFICVWDDHKRSSGWQQPTQQPEDAGAFATRRAAALQAYFEWMPIRAQKRDSSDLIHRTFRFGDLLDLTLLNARVHGRDHRSHGALVIDPERQLLGEAQEQWLFEELEHSVRRGARWRMVGQQLMFGQLANGACVFNPDQWENYPAARARILDKLAAAKIGNVAMLTANTHSSCASDIVSDPFDADAYDPATGKGSLAVEFALPAAASPQIGASKQVATLADVMRITHPHFKLVELCGRGYALFDITPARLQSEWYHVTTDARSTSEKRAAMLHVNSDENHLTVSAEASLPRAGAPAFAPDANDKVA